MQLIHLHFVLICAKINPKSFEILHAITCDNQKHLHIRIFCGKVLHRQWLRLQMGEQFFSVTKNYNFTKAKNQNET